MKPTFLDSRNVRNGAPRSIAMPVGNDPQAKVKVPGKLAPENQFFLTTKAGATVDSPGPLRNYLALTGWAVMTYLFKCMLKTMVFATFGPYFREDFKTQTGQCHTCDILVANIKEAGQ